MGFEIQKKATKQAGATTTKAQTMSQVDEFNKTRQSSGLKESKISQQDATAALQKGNGRSITNGQQYMYDEMEQVKKFSSQEPVQYGPPSLFNNYSVFIHPLTNRSNQIDPLFNKNGKGPFDKSWKDLDIVKLLQYFDPSQDTEHNRQGAAPYYANDFLFAKYYDFIGLNKLITLRRFPFPTFDNLIFPDQATNRIKPLAQAITYFGEPTDNTLKDLLKISGEIKWKNMESDVWDVSGNDSRGFSDSPVSGVGGLINNKKGENYSKSINTALKTSNFVAGNEGDISGRKAAEADYARQYGNDPDYTGKLLGPVNVINETYIRGRGIGVRNKYTVSFDYHLSSYKQVNPKIAMLDLISNMLALTYNNAKFFGGANRYIPGVQQFEFYGGEKAKQAFYSGNYDVFLDQTVKTFTGSFAQLGNGLGDLLGGIMSGNFAGLLNLGKKLGSTWGDLQSAKNRPAMLGFRAILSGLPVGEWHLTVGNPLNPIATIGNLVCKGFSIEVNEELGHDDFPTEIKFTVELEDGRPRDKGDIESMLSFGNGRMYHPPLGNADVGNASSSTSANGKPYLESNKKKNKSHPDDQKRGSGSIF